MKKNMKMVAIAMVGLLALVGCGNSSGNNTQNNSPLESEVEISTEVTAERIEETQVTTQKATQAPTQKVTQAPTQKVTQAPTQKATQAPTQKATQAPTQKVTQAPTQKVTQAPTQKVTQAPTQKVTQAPTQNSTQAITSVKMGNYNGAEINWLVLERSGNKALVISEQAIDEKKFNNELDFVTWETCTLRQWLNGSFYNNTFSAKEKARIISTTVVTEKDADFGTPGGNNTVDKIFALSEKEAKQYFNSDSSRKCFYNGQTRGWWLRSLGNNGLNADFVGSLGSIDFRNVDQSRICVRPAMWITLE